MKLMLYGKLVLERRMKRLLLEERHFWTGKVPLFKYDSVLVQYSARSFHLPSQHVYIFLERLFFMLYLLTGFALWNSVYFFLA